MTRSPDRLNRAGRNRIGTVARVAILAVFVGMMAWLAPVILTAQAPSGSPLPAGAPPLPPSVVPAPPAVVDPPAVASSPGIPQQPPMMQVAPRRFTFKIDPKTPLKDLLPVPPSTVKSARPQATSDLTKVAEIDFQAPLKKELAGEEGLKQTAHALAKINHLNAKETDGFLKALRGERKDLEGLPFAMEDNCRTTGERSKQFANAVATVRAALRQRFAQAAMNAPSALMATPPSAPARVVAPLIGHAVGAPGVAPPASAPMVFAVSATVLDADGSDGFWERYQASCAQEDKDLSRVNRTQIEHVTLARIAALMQVLAPEAPSTRLGLVKYLSGISHAAATRALARLAIYSAEDEVHKSAVEALKVRRERDYTDVLVRGLRYPWPAVARHAADAIVKLERADLIPELLDVLDEPDPRSPVMKDKVAVVREVVRVNHHKNCLLCHAPGNTASVSPDTLTAAVPLPGEPLPSPADGYRPSHPDVLVRIDVTYLRQDFSAYQAVTDANPWPEMQRFDYLVRTRPVTDEEATAFRETFGKVEPNQPSPYQRAALAALRDLTGKDTEATAGAWRKLLNQPKSAKPRS